jgi:hypothetical protein
VRIARSIARTLAEILERLPPQRNGFRLDMGETIQDPLTNDGALKFGKHDQTKARYTDARPILSALAISVGPFPSAFSFRTWSASIEAGRPL